jgi:hypothetical protein
MGNQITTRSEYIRCICDGLCKNRKQYDYYSCTGHSADTIKHFWRPLFLSLETGKTVRNKKWVQLPINDDFIEEMDNLGRRQNQPDDDVESNATREDILLDIPVVSDEERDAGDENESVESVGDIVHDENNNIDAPPLKHEEELSFDHGNMIDVSSVDRLEMDVSSSNSATLAAKPDIKKMTIKEITEWN